MKKQQGSMADYRNGLISKSKFMPKGFNVFNS